MNNSYAVLIPAYNSQETITELLERIQKVGYNCHIFVVDDGSTDKTAEVLVHRTDIFLTKSRKNSGKGTALKRGLQNVFSQNHNYAAVIFIDSDLQHLPEKIPQFIAAFEQGRGDFIIGKRAFGLQQMPLARIVSNFITSILLSLKVGSKVYDSQCGYRLIEAGLIQKCRPFSSLNYAFETEILLKSARAGCRFHHVDIPTIYGGEISNIKGFRDTIAFIKAFLKY